MQNAPKNEVDDDDDGVVQIMIKHEIQEDIKDIHSDYGKQYPPHLHSCSQKLMMDMILVGHKGITTLTDTVERHTDNINFVFSS